MGKKFFATKAKKNPHFLKLNMKFLKNEGFNYTLSDAFYANRVIMTICQRLYHQH